MTSKFDAGSTTEFEITHRFEHFPGKRSCCTGQKLYYHKGNSEMFWQLNLKHL